MVELPRRKVLVVRQSEIRMRWTSSVPNLKSAIVANLRIRDTSSLFSVACWSPACAARCDGLRGQ
ncbi:MAG: hypothetical protein QOF70_4157, partial [Acetobacteraceae bacterium]|nr:hypothetical protein [Acetobacteraceae bacterium]